MVRTRLSAPSAAALALLLARLGRADRRVRQGSRKKKPKDPAADINVPRPEARKIAFTATQGTWTSVDVAPDGQKLVFDLLGDIYELPAAGGEARG